MNLENVGISYNASYLLQGNQIERCKKSIDLNVKVTELLLRTDKKDCDIDNIKKVYKGKVLFHVPAINPDLANLKSVNELVRTLSGNGIKMITINASNLSLDLFEWSTLEEQKKYFLNIVTAIATLASNKIEVAIDNLKHNESNTMFGSDIAQVRFKYDWKIALIILIYILKYRYIIIKKYYYPVFYKKLSIFV